LRSESNLVNPIEKIVFPEDLWAADINKLFNVT